MAADKIDFQFYALGTTGDHTVAAVKPGYDIYINHISIGGKLTGNTRMFLYGQASGIRKFGLIEWDGGALVPDQIVNREFPFGSAYKILTEADGDLRIGMDFTNMTYQVSISGWWIATAP